VLSQDTSNIASGGTARQTANKKQNNTAQQSNQKPTTEARRHWETRRKSQLCLQCAKNGIHPSARKIQRLTTKNTEKKAEVTEKYVEGRGNATKLDLNRLTKSTARFHQQHGEIQGW